MEEIAVLQASDGIEHKISVKAAQMSVTLANLIKDAGISDPLPVPNVTGSVLEKIVSYCTYHTDHPDEGTDEKKDNRSEEVRTWDEEFCKIDQTKIFELILATNFLDILPLMDLLCQNVADNLRGKTPEEIRQTFNIANDFTPEEEEQVRKENSWCESE